jgi:hypothetical protein
MRPHAGQFIDLVGSLDNVISQEQETRIKVIRVQSVRTVCVTRDAALIN